ncbi:MAG TPA: alpha/beta hydrolase [Bacteroidia bacterium]|nr:alpha/beta hydrolase [Bacteroidia bacterium]
MTAKGIALVNGAKLNFEMAGNGRPLIFIHGMGLDMRMWDYQFFEFSKKYFIVRYDLRGFGKSSLPGTEHYSHHEDLLALMNFLGIRKATLMGLSLGGRVAMEFSLAFPERVNELILVDPSLTGFDFKEDIYGEVFAIARAFGAEAGTKAWKAHRLFKHAMNNVQSAEKLNQMLNDYSGWHWVNKNPCDFLDPPAVSQTSKIKAQTLIVIGEHDLVDLQSIASFLEKTIKHSKKVVIEQAGHMTNIEQPTIFNALVEEFLGV